MRDPQRLHKFYDEVKRIHMEYFPDLRCAQMMDNFRDHELIKCGVDWFFYEENHFLRKLEEYAKSCKHFD